VSPEHPAEQGFDSPPGFLLRWPRSPGWRGPGRIGPPAYGDQTVDGRLGGWRGPQWPLDVSCVAMAARRSTKYEDIAKGLEELFAVAADLGQSDRLDRGRFGEYRRRLTKLMEIAAIHRAGQTLPDTGVRDVEANALLFRVALMEAMEAGAIASLLRLSPETVAAEKLGIVLSGPRLPSDEDPASNRARNVQFELTVADLPRRGGYSPVLGEHPDLRVHVVDRDYLIECKRIFSPAKTATRINEAGKQLHGDRKNATASARAIIAISLSRVLNPRDKAFRISRTDVARKGLVAWLEEARHVAQQHYHRFSQRGFAVATFLHASSAFENVETGTFDYGTPVDRRSVRAAIGTIRQVASEAGEQPHRPGILSPRGIDVGRLRALNGWHPRPPCTRFSIEALHERQRVMLGITMSGDPEIQGSTADQVHENTGDQR